MAEPVDVAILGGGNAGYACALRAAELGLSVSLIERDKVGGTCLHRGCIPTKALLHSAEIVDNIRSAGDFGLEFASLYRSFGSEVTVLEALPRLAPGEDQEVSAELTRQFKRRGIRSLPGVKVVSAEPTPGGASVTYETPDGKTEVATA